MDTQWLLNHIRITQLPLRAAKDLDRLNDCTFLSFFLPIYKKFLVIVVGNTGAGGTFIDMISEIAKKY